MTLTRLRNEALKAAVKGQELYMQISGADVLHLLDTIDMLKRALEFYTTPTKLNYCQTYYDERCKHTVHEWSGYVCDDAGETARAALAKLETESKGE